jgi:arylsulfatase
MRFLLLFGLALLLGAPCGTFAAERLNFLIIVADDLGYSDLGAFGGEIDTPNLNQLANAGMRFTNFHAAATCSPTRAMLLSGVDHHRAGIGTMSELINDTQRGHPGYEGYLNQRVVTVAELLRDAGYDTLMSGKWHLGVAPEQDPSQRGFARTFALEEAGHDHFGRTSLLSGVPHWLDLGVRGFFKWLDATLERFGHSNMLIKSLCGFTYRENGKDVTLPANFYSSDYFSDKMIQYLNEHAQQNSQKPFFAYLAFTAPHFPLQAPPASIAKYKGRYDAGWSVLREQRIRNQQALGLLPQQQQPPTADFGMASTLDPWQNLTPPQQQRAIRNMEIYAGMVDRLDWNVGRVLEQLRKQGALDNTVIIFMSDNGAEGGDARLTVKQVAGINLREEPLEQMGSRGTFDSYGPNWAQAATAPHRLYKATTAEGGIVVPAFISGPAVQSSGSISNSLATVRDILPTVLALADVPLPTANYRGRNIIPPSGVSLTPLLNGSASSAHAADETFGWEIFGQRAMRQGDWKITWITPPRGPGRWQLFDLSNDPGELHDRSAEYPQKLAELIRAWDIYADGNGLILQTQVVGQ